MTSVADIARLGVVDLAAAYREGELTPDDAVNAYAQRIAAFNPHLNVFLELALDAAREAARDSTARWREGIPLSDIDGVPFGVKANIALSGLTWHGGIGAYKDQIAEYDASVVAKLRASGAIPLGTLNMHEGALGATTDNPHFGRCNNPWDTKKTPGGSSGGSGAAVAAGLCAFALGTDTMGSVRIPSAYCGVTGLKPTYGAVSGDGLIDLSPTLDHIGPHAQRASDLAPVFAQMTEEPFANLRLPTTIGIADWGTAVDVTDDVDAGFAQGTQTIATLADTKHIDLSGFDFGALRRRGLLISEVEGWKTHEAIVHTHPQGFSRDFVGLLKWGADQPAEKVKAAYESVKKAGEQLLALLQDVDVLVTPTAPQGPFAFEDPVPANQADFTCIANFAGAPAVAVPACIDGKPPASLQFIAAPGADRLALGAAIAFERARGTAPSPVEYF